MLRKCGAITDTSIFACASLIFTKQNIFYGDERIVDETITGFETVIRSTDFRLTENELLIVLHYAFLLIKIIFNIDENTPFSTARTQASDVPMRD
jgi:hypothetical protein